MQVPDIKVIDKDFNLIATLDSYTSFTGARSLWEVGNCELHVPLNTRGARKLDTGLIIFIDNNRAWEITGLKLTEDKDLEAVATGKELKNILSSRLIVPDRLNDAQHFGFDRFPPPENPEAPAESIYKYYVNKHAISPEDPKRKLPGLITAPDEQRGVKTRWSERFKSLTDCFKDIGEFSGMGYAVMLQPDNKQFVFDVIAEQIQSAGSDHPVIFSVDFENVKSISYSREVSGETTVTYAGGYGSDENRLIQQVSREDEEMNYSGFKRKESWLDIGSAQTAEDLIFEAKHQLSKQDKKETFSAGVIEGRSFEYLKDWDIGSIVTVESKGLGLRQDKKITAVKEVYERNKTEVIPTFGKRTKNILDEIRKVEVIR